MTDERVVVMVLGADRVGIVAGISKVLAENNVNILDLTSSKIRDLFVMIMLVDISGSRVSLEELKEMLNKEAVKIGVQVSVQHENLFRYMHRV
ncbi:MAG: ACT domain-containing protein [Nitrososphaerales archaeon]